jgi:hypothetical protein
LQIMRIISSTMILRASWSLNLTGCSLLDGPAQVSPSSLLFHSSAICSLIFSTFPLPHAASISTSISAPTPSRKAFDKAFYVVYLVCMYLVGKWTWPRTMHPVVHSRCPWKAPSVLGSARAKRITFRDSPSSGHRFFFEAG